MKHFLRMVFLVVLAMALSASALASQTSPKLIEQFLLQRSGNTLVGMDEKAMMLPAVYTDGTDLSAGTEIFVASQYQHSQLDLHVQSGKDIKLWSQNQIRNAMDKLVFVKNVSDKPIAIRTVVAFPKPISQRGSKADADTGWGGKVLELYNDVDYEASWVCDVSIDGYNPDTVLYDLLVLSYRSTLQPGFVTPPSLLQIALSKTVSNQDLLSFNLINYQLLVVSEAYTTMPTGQGTSVQPTGYYEITQSQHPWNTKSVTVSSGN